MLHYFTDLKGKPLPAGCNLTVPSGMKMEITAWKQQHYRSKHIIEPTPQCHAGKQKRGKHALGTRCYPVQMHLPLPYGVLDS